MVSKFFEFEEFEPSRSAGYSQLWIYIYVVDSQYERYNIQNNSVALAKKEEEEGGIIEPIWWISSYWQL